MYRVCVLLVLLETETSVMATWWMFLQPIATFPFSTRWVSHTAPDQVCVLSHSNYYRCVSSLAISLSTTYCMPTCVLCSKHRVVVIMLLYVEIFIGIARLHIDSLCIAGHFLAVFCKCLYSTKCLYATLSSFKKLLLSSLIFLLISLLTSSLLFGPSSLPLQSSALVVASCISTRYFRTLRQDLIHTGLNWSQCVSHCKSLWTWASYYLQTCNSFTNNCATIIDPNLVPELVWMHDSFDRSVNEWIIWTNFAFLSSLCSRCWTIVAPPQKAKSSLIFCLTGLLKSQSLCLLI